MNITNLSNKVIEEVIEIYDHLTLTLDHDDLSDEDICKIMSIPSTPNDYRRTITLTVVTTSKTLKFTTDLNKLDRETTLDLAYMHGIRLWSPIHGEWEDIANGNTKL